MGQPLMRPQGPSSLAPEPRMPLQHMPLQGPPQHHPQHHSPSPGQQPPYPQPQGQYTQSSAENFQGLQRAIQTMEDKGLQNDPRYGQLLNIRSKHPEYVKMYPSGPPSSDQVGFFCNLACFVVCFCF